MGNRIGNQALAFADGSIPGSKLAANTIPVDKLNANIAVPIHLDEVIESDQPSIVFPDLLTSDYDLFEIELFKILPATDSAQLFCRTAVSGSVLDEGASDYEYCGLQYRVSTGTISPVNSAGDDGMLLTFGNVGNDTNEDGVSGKITIYKPTDATFTAVSWDEITNKRADGNLEVNYGSGQRISAAAAATVGIAFGSGNITSGTARLSAKRVGG